ncbi:hypothetical protein BXY53_1866 [Dichotomicrobium thermohalophilum]|uniref:BppU N-terminal domain-containing protein n=2 Tax=Dichotomicrobium thermohalophilum TaxID=933063 RepID=A0A397Q662_9HYPH|nr:hypothetical protein BXY53_1866 [Dichotomicrobium thermohalophilum]
MTTLNLEAATNADWRQPFKAIDASGGNLSLTGAKIRMDVRDRGGNDALSLAIGDGLTVTDAAAGEFELEVDREAMAAVAPGLYRFDLLIEIDGLALTAARGTVNIRDGVTAWGG